MNLLRIFCALVLLSLGLGHKTVQAAAHPQAYSEAYRLPDGSFAEICADGHGQHGSGEAVLPVCEVCLLAASFLLPPPAGGVGIALAEAFLVNPLRVESVHVGFTALARPMSRGPPLAI